LWLHFFFSAQQLFAQSQKPPLTPAIKAEVVNNLAISLVKNYVDLETATKMSEAVEKHLKDGDYDQITKPNDFAQKLTADLRAVKSDVHLSVRFDTELARNLADRSGVVSAERREQNLAQYRQQNFGFKKLEILSGNIAYLSIDQFYGFNDSSKDVVNFAFSFLRNTDALIIDLRNNGGGSADTVKYVSSFLLPPNTQLSSFYERRTNKTETAYTYQPSVPVSFVGKPIYILVGRRSFSAAEGFAYDLQALHRATVIGEKTGGGAHAVGPNDISNGFICLVPYAQAINPVTRTNWEGVGVTPDIRINVQGALDAAILNYYDFQIDHITEAKKLASIKWARDILKAKLHPIQLDTSILQTYVGNFGDRLVSVRQGDLIYKGKDGKESKLIALSEAVFKLEDNDLMKMEFVKGSSGKIDELKFIFADGFETTYPRKKQE
jgi:hypothetical protein